MSALTRGEPTWQIARLYPPQGYWSEAQYLDLDTNHLIEFVDGRLEFLPMPTFFHQAIVLFLYGALNTFVRGRLPGEVSVAPCRIRTLPGKYREPDVLYVRPERLPDRKQPAEGADLVIEVVSGEAEDRQRDLEEKRDEYAKTGISEYWIVDPQERAIAVLRLAGMTYREHGVFLAGQHASSDLVSGFSVSVNETFAAGEGKL